MLHYIVAPLLASSLALGSASHAPKEQQREQARLDALVVEVQQEDDDGLAVTAQFLLRESGAAGELRLSLWRGIAEASFSIDGVPHMILRYTDSSEEQEPVWLSPLMEGELERGSAELMQVFWAVLADPQVFAQIERKNPACSVFKWGMKGVVALAGAACCGGGFGFGCGVCTLGGLAATSYLDGIDCNKEYKPECPIQ